MMKQEKEYKILKAKKAKVDVQIDKYQSLQNFPIKIFA